MHYPLLEPAKSYAGLQLQQATWIGRGDHLDAGRLDRCHLLIEQGQGHVSMQNVVDPGAAAAEVGVCHLDQLQAGNSLQQFSRSEANFLSVRWALSAGSAVRQPGSSADRLHTLTHPGYSKSMAEAKKIDFEDPAAIFDDEDEETLAAIDEGVRDADAGRTVPMEEVRKFLPQWITASSSRKER